MEQPTYNPQTLQYTFNPERAPDLTVGVRENNQRMNEALQTNINQMISDKETIRRNMDLEAEGARELAKFSKTLSKFVTDSAYDKADDEYAEGQQAAFENGVIPETADTTAEATQVTGAAAKAVAANPDNADVIQPAVRGSRFFQMGYNNARGSQALASYPTFVQDYVAKRNPRNSAEAMALAAEAQKEWFKGVNTNGMSKGYLTDQFYPQLNKLQIASTAKIRRQAAINEGFTIQTEATAAFQADRNLGTYLGTLASSVDGNGNPLGYAGAWRIASAQITEGIKNGTIQESDLIALENQRIPGDPKGRTYGQLHGNKFATMRRGAEAARRQQWNNEQADKRMEFEQQEQAVVDSFLQDETGFTDENIDEAQAAFQARYGYTSSKLEKLKNGSVDGIRRKKQEEQIEDLQAMGLLTPERLEQFDPELRRKYASVAAQQGRQAADPAVKSSLDIIKKMVEFGPETSPIAQTPSGRQSPTVALMTVKMQQHFRRKLQEYEIAGNPDPVGAALQDTRQHFADTAEVGPKGYKGFEVDADSTTNARIISQDRIASINETLTSLGKDALDKPFALYDQAQLEEMSKGYGEPGWRPHASLTYIGTKQGVDPLTVLNRQRKAAGMNELPPTPAMEIVQELTPQQRAAINNIGTPEVSGRVMGSTGEYRPEAVPGGYGEAIGTAAKKYGIPAPILAAMFHHESAGFDPNVIAGRRLSSAGAIGIAQFMPGTAADMGVDPRNPQQAIDGGAKYLKQMLDMFGGDMRLALTAYNAGPGNVQRYGGPIPGNAESQNYYKNVMKEVYRYGGGSSSLQDSATMRPSLAYISGNIGPTSTGPHLDVKQSDRGEFSPTALDNFVEVEDPEYGRVPLSRVGVTGDFASHTRRGSHGIDYGTYSGTKVFVKNGAKVVGTRPSEHGDVVTIELPNGKRYTFLHGTAPK